jgi:hypothetical protein
MGPPLYSHEVRDRVRWWKARLLTVAAWSLLFAILPTLTYMGHWPRELDLPGAHPSLRLGASADTHDPGHEDGDEGLAHQRHCHGSPSTCSDVPFTGTSGLAVLNEWLALAGVSSLLVMLAGRWWRPGRPFAPPPELRPPRRPAVVAS